jgi:hypothetical protein
LSATSVNGELAVKLSSIGTLTHNPSGSRTSMLRVT